MVAPLGPQIPQLSVHMWQHVLCGLVADAQQRQQRRHMRTGDAPPGYFGRDTDDTDDDTDDDGEDDGSQGGEAGGGSNDNAGGNASASATAAKGSIPEAAVLGRLRLVCRSFRDAVDSSVEVLEVSGAADGTRRYPIQGTRLC